MKKIFKYMLAIIPFLIACDTDTEVVLPPEYNAKWEEQTKLTFNPIGEFNGFVYNVNESTGESFWGETEAEFSVDFEIGDYNYSEISKIDFYAYVQETNGDNNTYHGGTSGKLITTINNPVEVFSLTIDADDVFALYSSELASTHNGSLNPEDLVELKWVITGNDGKVFDSRSECVGFNCTWGIKTDIKYVDTWLGEFEYNWTIVGSDTVIYSWADIVVGSTGTVVFSPSSDTPGAIDVDDLSMGASYGAKRPGTIAYDQDTNTLTVTDITFWANEWELVSVTPEVLTVNWTYYYTQWYQEFGTVQIIRSDGLEWPAGLTIVNND